MKLFFEKITKVAALLMFSVLAIVAEAKKDVGRAAIDSIKTAAFDKQVRIYMWVSMDDVYLDDNSAAQLVPVIRQGDNVMPLDTLLLTGRTKHIMYQRSKSLQRQFPHEKRRKNATRQQYLFEKTIPLTDAAYDAKISIITDLCGCGWEWEELQDEALAQALPLADYLPARMRAFVMPELAYVVPEADSVVLEDGGEMRLQFNVNKTDVRPELGQNKAELEKMLETLDGILNNKYATLTAASIRGYASPEGGYANNVRLANGRAAAISAYVEKAYKKYNIKMSYVATPEDWDGLVTRIEADAAVPYRAELLSLIAKRQSYRNIDDLERQIKALHGGEVYAYLDAHHLAPLRRSEYAMRYKIRALTVEEAKELLYSHPRMVSQNDMYRVAQTYAAGSEEFNKVFDIAVRVYPDDPVANLNAAVTALYRRDDVSAEMYLKNAKECPEKVMAEKALTYIREYKREVAAFERR